MIQLKSSAYQFQVVSYIYSDQSQFHDSQTTLQERANGSTHRHMMRSGECFDILEGGSRDYTNECRRVWREGVSSLKDLKGRERAAWCVRRCLFRYEPSVWVWNRSSLAKRARIGLERDLRGVKRVVEAEWATGWEIPLANVPNR